MSDRSTTERPAEAAGRNAGLSPKDHLVFLIGIGAIVAAVVGGSCSTNARIGDLREEIGTVRADVGTVRADVGTVRAEVGDLRVEVGTEIRHLRAEFGAEFRGLRAEVGAEFRDVRGEIRDVRARVENLEDSTAASFAAVRGQIGAVAVCVLEIRNLVGGDRQDDGRVSTTCDDALSAILAPSPPAGR